MVEKKLFNNDNSACLILTLSGVATILSLMVFNIKQRTALDQFEEVVQESCQE